MMRAEEDNSKCKWERGLTAAFLFCFIRNYTKIICECETLKICKSQYKHSSILRFDIC